MNSENNCKPNAIINEIVAKYLGVKTLETQNSDALDFHDLAAGTLRAALEAAFNAGYEIAQNHSEAK